MATGVLIETSFLITLADNSRKHHDAARKYWRPFLENQIPIFLSAIVVAEFCLKQETPADMIRRPGFGIIINADADEIGLGKHRSVVELRWEAKRLATLCSHGELKIGV